MPVPKHGWNTPVRVCNNCYNQSMNESTSAALVADDGDVRVRKYGEVVVNTLSTVANVLEIPKGKKIFFWLKLKGRGSIF